MPRFFKTNTKTENPPASEVTEPVLSEAVPEGVYSVDYIEIELDDRHYFAPAYAAHRPAVKNMIKGKLYEPDTHELIQRVFEKFGGSMVHAGTFFGDMLPNFSQHVPGTVYAFEPVLENFVLANQCIQKNRLENVILLNAGLGSEIASMKVNTSSPNGVHAGGGSRISSEGEICVVMDIDRINFTDLTMIQLDVEGFELNALTGAQQTIRTHRPIIAIEDNQKNCDAFLAENEYEFVHQLKGLAVWCPKENAIYLDFLRRTYPQS